SPSRLGSLFLPHMSEVRLTLDDTADDGQDFFIWRQLVLSRQLVPQGSVLLDHDAPLALVLVQSALLRIATNANEVGLTLMCCFDVPPPILLVRLNDGHPERGQPLPEPHCYIFAKATVIDEVRLDFRQVEPIGFDQDVVVYV